MMRNTKMLIAFGLLCLVSPALSAVQEEEDQKDPTTSGDKQNSSSVSALALAQRAQYAARHSERGQPASGGTPTTEDGTELSKSVRDKRDAEGSLPDEWRFPDKLTDEEDNQQLTTLRNQLRELKNQALDSAGDEVTEDTDKCCPDKSKTWKKGFGIAATGILGGLAFGLPMYLNHQLQTSTTTDKDWSNYQDPELSSALNELERSKILVELNNTVNDGGFQNDSSWDALMGPLQPFDAVASIAAALGVIYCMVMQCIKKGSCNPFAYCIDVATAQINADVGVATQIMQIEMKMDQLKMKNKLLKGFSEATMRLGGQLGKTNRTNPSDS